MQTSGWLHKAAFEGGGYHQRDLTKIADRRSPVVNHKYALVGQVVERIGGILSVEALPFEHDRGIMRSLQTPVLFHRVEAGDVEVSNPSLTRED